MSRPRLLDLFCGGGGAGMGYARAGFDVVGVDLKRQPRYPFTFLQGDAIAFMADGGWQGFDAIHASPPCQFASRARLVGTRKTNAPLNLIPATRQALIDSGLPYVIENVEHARSHLIDPLLLCGSMFDLAIEREDGQRYELRRHRLFESSMALVAPGRCQHSGKVLGVYASKGDHVQGTDRVTGRYVMGGQTVQTIEEGRALMGIPWLIWSDLKEAIPPAYTEALGRQMLGQGMAFQQMLAWPELAPVTA